MLHGIVEIFVNDGEAVFTAQIFPDEKNDAIQLFSNGTKSKFSKLKIWEMKSVW